MTKETPMKYRVLGGTGMKVSQICLGAMMFGAWGNPDPQECARIVHRALDAGINFIDTADVYDFGRSEEILGAALEGRRDHVVLASKVNNRMDDEINHAGNSRRWIMREVEASLRRLRTDHLDLYQVHRPDPETDLDETLGVLSDLVRQGKVRAIGTSTFPAELIVEAQWMSERRGQVRFWTEQPPYSLFAREIEKAVLPTCQRFGLGVIVWSPLNGGWLTGKYRRGAEPPADSRAAREPEHFDYESEVRERKFDLVESLSKLAAESGCSLTKLALAFVLNHPAVTSAIIGPRTEQQLETQLGAEAVLLPPELLDAIDRVVPPGVTVNSRDSGYDPPAIVDATLRRRQK